MTEDVQKAVLDILKYIQKYPDAKHTKNGIIRNWIYQQRLEEKLQVAETAINFLVKDGILEKIEKEDQEFYLRVNRNKISDISSRIVKLQKLHKLEFESEKN